MVWRRPGDKPLSELMMVSSLVHLSLNDLSCHLVATAWLHLLLPGEYKKLTEKIPGCKTFCTFVNSCPESLIQLKACMEFRKYWLCPPNHSWEVKWNCWWFTSRLIPDRKSLGTMQIQIKPNANIVFSWDWPTTFNYSLSDCIENSVGPSTQQMQVRLHWNCNISK